MIYCIILMVIFLIDFLFILMIIILLSIYNLYRMCMVVDNIVIILIGVCGILVGGLG